MAVDEKISQLPEALTLAEDDYVPIVQASSGLNKKAKVSAFVPSTGFKTDDITYNAGWGDGTELVMLPYIVYKVQMTTVGTNKLLVTFDPTAPDGSEFMITDGSVNGNINSLVWISGIGNISPRIVMNSNETLVFTKSDGIVWLTSRTNKNDSTAYTDAGLALKADQSSVSNVDNTSDANKPVSIAGMASNSTGVKTGGVLSIGTGGAGVATTFTIASGVGVVVDNTTIPATLINVSWSAKTDVAVTNIGTQPLTFIAIDSSGNVIQQATDFNGLEHRLYMVIGSVIHTNLTTVTAVNQGQHLAISPQAQLNDLFQSLAGFNITGNIFSANGTNLNINKSAGEIFKQGANYSTSANNPNIVITNSLTAGTFRYNNQTGSASGILSAIDPNNYDLAGVTTAVSVNKFTIQRIFLFSSNLLAIQRGQHEYNSLAEAKASIQTETFIVNSSIIPNGVLRAYLIVQQGTTALNSATKAFFLEAPKFGGTAGVGGLSVSTLQNAYDNSISPEILTDATRGAVSIKRGSSADTDLVFEVLNGAGTVTSSIDGNGLNAMTNASVSSATVSTPTFFDTAKKLITTTAQLWGTWVQTWGSKATPVDADTIGFHDSASTFVGVKSTLLNLWTTYLLPKVQALGYLSGTGLTANFLPKFTALGTLADSYTRQDYFAHSTFVKGSASYTNAFTVTNVGETIFLFAAQNDGANVQMNSIAHQFGLLGPGQIIFSRSLTYSNLIFVRGTDTTSTNYIQGWINSTQTIYGFRYTNTLVALWQANDNTASTILQKWSNASNVQIGVLQNDGLYFGTGTKSASAIFHLDSTTQGFLPPRMTTAQRTNIVSPATGLVVYDTSLLSYYQYSGSAWSAMGGGSFTSKFFEPFGMIDKYISTWSEADQAYYQLFKCPYDMTITKLFTFTLNVGTDTVRMNICDSSGTELQEGSFTPTTTGYESCTITSTNLTGGSDYWIGIKSEAGSWNGAYITTALSNGLTAVSSFQSGTLPNKTGTSTPNRIYMAVGQ